MAVSVRKSITHKLNEKLELIFQVTQHTRDEALLTSFIKYLVPPPPPDWGEGRGTCGAPEGTPRWIAGGFLNQEKLLIIKFQDFQILKTK